MSAARPRLNHHVIGFVKSEGDGAVFREQIIHFSAECEAFGAVIEEGHFFESAVEFWVDVAGFVFSCGGNIFAVKKEEIVFGIGVVRAPTGAGSDLELTAVLFFEHFSKGIFDDIDFDSELLELSLLVFCGLAFLRAGRRHIHGEFERFASFGIDPVGVAGAGDEFAGAFEVESIRVFPVFEMSKDAWGNDLGGGWSDAIFENLAVARGVVCAGQGLAKISVGEDGIGAVKANEKRAEFRIFFEDHSACFKVGREVMV